MNCSMEEAKMLLNNIIGEYIMGSTAYGMSIKTDNHVSDEDIKAISILPIKESLILQKPVETLTLHPEDFDEELLSIAKVKEPTDFEVHTLKKFMTLAMDCNPTIIEMLFVEERFIKRNSIYAQVLRDNRNLFLSKRSIKSFGGYAIQQLIRIKHALFLQTPEGIEKQKELNDALNRMILDFNEKYGDYNLKITLEEDGEIYVSMNGKIPLDKFLGMMSEIENCRSTYNKMNHRNRKSETRILKHSAHLIRLLESGIELNTTGTLKVYRSNSEKLIKIRKGEVSQEEIFAEAERLNQQLMALTKESVLPDRVDSKKINDLYAELTLMYNKDKGYIG